MFEAKKDGTTEANLVKNFKSLLMDLGWDAYGQLERLMRKIPSTARDADYYRGSFFPECETEQDLLDYLNQNNGKLVMDVGSGLTHKNPYSLINVVARDKKTKAIFLGIEPRIGEGQEAFGRKDKRDLISAIRRRRKERLLVGTPGQKYAIAAEVPGLALENGQVDIILSSFLIGYWITKREKLLEIFQEFWRLLREGGEIRLHPVSRTLFERDNELGKFIKEHFVIEDTKQKKLVVMRKISK